MEKKIQDTIKSPRAGCSVQASDGTIIEDRKNLLPCLLGLVTRRSHCRFSGGRDFESLPSAGGDGERRGM
jgi:hypothetical protein